METCRSYVEILRSELEQRLNSNSRYSLRAFARDLEMTPSQLSLIMNEKKGLSETSALRIAKKLSLNPKDTEIFCSLVLSLDSKSKAKRAEALIKLSQLDLAKSITLDSFRVIADWYHFAIMELTMQKGFKSDLLYISNQLGISKFEAEQAIQRLERLDLIEKSNGRWRQTEIDLSTPNDIPSDAIKKFHKQVLQKAMDAITFQSTEDREISSLIIGINKTDLPKYKNIIRKFHREINSLAETKKNKRTHVYCLNTQFFGLSKGDGDKS